jgi:ABC-type amino acid transport substrate-binding protein
MLADLRHFKLNAVLIIDSFIMPEAEKIKLSSSLCDIAPVFVQKKSAPIRAKPEDYNGAIIGVRYGSLLHVHLLEHYSSFVQLKTYSPLENGIFDLVSERIDVLFTEKAFFNERVLETPLGSKNNPSKLIASPLKATMQFNTKMVLAFRTSESKLLDKIKAYQASSKMTPCANLLEKPNNPVTN